MRIMRSFPEPGKIPPGRAYVADDLEKLYTPVDHGGRADFSGLRAVTDDVILVEWDVAVDRANLARFAKLAEGRDWPVVAPHYKLGDDGELHWVHFRRRGSEWRPVFPGEWGCDQFALGLVFLPGGLLAGCPRGDEWSPAAMNEGVIGRYLRGRPDWRPVPIAWDITTVHLH
jgi:hypothetical protein